jgi:peptidoglycan hydrolase CwlO-like protein
MTEDNKVRVTNNDGDDVSVQMTQIQEGQGPSWFWKFFGPAIISLVTVLFGVILSIFNGIISDLRTDNNRISAENAALKAKVESLEGRITPLWQSVSKLNDISKDRTIQVEGIINRISNLENQSKSLQDDTKSLSLQVGNLRERVAVLEKK